MHRAAAGEPLRRCDMWTRSLCHWNVILTAHCGGSPALCAGPGCSPSCSVLSCRAEVSAAALSVVRNLSTPEDDQIHKTLFKLGVFNMLVHVVARHKDPAVKQNALRVLLDLASAALSSPSTSPVKPAGPSSSNTAAAGASSDKAKSDKANEYTAGNAVDRLVKRGLPAVLLKLLHKDAPVALQTRAIMVSLLCSFLLAPSLSMVDD